MASTVGTNDTDFLRRATYGGCSLVVGGGVAVVVGVEGSE